MVGDATRVTYWLDEWTRSRRGVSAPRRRADETRIDRYLRSQLGGRSVRRLRRSDIEKWMERLRGEGVGNSTIYATLMALRQALDRAVGEGALDRNPAAGLSVPGANVVRSVAGVEAFTEEEFQQLLEAVDPLYRPMVRFSGRTGASWQEVNGLRDVDLYLDEQRASVGRWRVVEQGGDLREEPGDPATVRLVELSEDLVQELEWYLRETADWRTRDWNWLFLTKRDHRHPLRPNFNQFVWRPALRAAGLDDRGRTFHDLRHTAARRALAEGGSLSDVTRMLGLSSDVVTRKMYGHWLDVADQRPTPRESRTSSR